MTHELKAANPRLSLREAEWSSTPILFSQLQTHFCLCLTLCFFIWFSGTWQEVRRCWFQGRTGAIIQANLHIHSLNNSSHPVKALFCAVHFFNKLQVLLMANSGLVGSLDSEHVQHMLWFHNIWKIWFLEANIFKFEDDKTWHRAHLLLMWLAYFIKP